MSFDVLAPHYHWMEFVLAGEKLQHCRKTFLDQMPDARSILLLGEGHGRCLVECCRRFPNARISCVDASELMLAQARRQMTRHELELGCVEFIHGNVLTWKPADETYDLLITNFFLDCFRADQLEQIIPRYGGAMNQDANWLIADFQLPPAGLRRIRGLLILGMMYTFFRATTRLSARKLTTPDSFLERAGFTLHRRAEFEWGLLHSDWWTR